MPVSIDPDQQKNEETTKLRHITPVISERWQDVDKVLMEYYFTDGRISVDEYNMAHRGKPKKADYLLLYRDNIPLLLLRPRRLTIVRMKDTHRLLNMQIFLMFRLPTQPMAMTLLKKI